MLQTDKAPPHCGWLWEGGDAPAPCPGSAPNAQAPGQGTQHPPAPSRDVPAAYSSRGSPQALLWGQGSWGCNIPDVWLVPTMHPWDKRVLRCPGCPPAPIPGEGRAASTERPVCLCTHLQGTRDFPRGTLRATRWSPWGPGWGPGTGTVSPSSGSASAACFGTERLTRTRGLWCCQDFAAG